MPVGILVDTTRCTGCRGCQAACKQWNLLPAVETSFSTTMTNPPALSANTYNHVEFFEVEHEGKFNWIFVHKRCMHCSDPACVSVCPVAALHKRDNGPVVWDADKCFGCRYCQNACPWDIPKFEWDEAWPEIKKCTLCWNRLEDGMQPACTKTCPPGALKFGDRDDLLNEGRQRVADLKAEGYSDAYLYGENELGGLHVMYVLDDSPAVYGLPESPQVATKNLVGNWLSAIATAGVIAAIPFWWLFKRKESMAAEDNSKGGA